jgi:hypothetical protein
MNKYFARQARKFAGISAIGATALTASPAFAAVDVSGATSAIGEAATAGAAIGLAVLLLLVGIKVFKWVRGGM